MESTQAQIIFKLSISLLSFVIFLIGFFFLWKHLKRQDHLKIKANFVYKDRTIERKSFYAIVDEIEYKDFTYDYDDNLTIKIKGVKNIYYRIGERKPLDFESNLKSTITHDEFRRIAKSKVLRDLLDDDDSLDKNTKMLMITIIVVGIILAFIIYKIGTSPHEIVIDQAVKNALKEVVKEAIKGV